MRENTSREASTCEKSQKWVRIPNNTVSSMYCIKDSFVGKSRLFSKKVLRETVQQLCTKLFISAYKIENKSISIFMIWYFMYPFKHKAKSDL